MDEEEKKLQEWKEYLANNGSDSDGETQNAKTKKQMGDDLNNFEQRLAVMQGTVLEGESSDEEESKENVGNLAGSGLELYKANQKNDILVDKVIEQENEIKSLKDALKLARPTKGGKDINTDDKDFLNRKLLELAKKNKDLNVKLEHEKTKAAKAMTEVKRLRALEEEKSQKPSTGWKTNPLPHQVKPGKPQKPDEEDMTVEELVVEYRKKFKEADKKVQELRVQVESQKTEITKATRIISRELGETNINIDKLAGEGSKWKGRAQKIEVLKAKVKDLKGQLIACNSDIADNLSVVSETTSMSSAKSTITAMSTTSSRFEERTQARLASKAEERRREIAELKATLEERDEEIKSLKQRLAGANARKTTVEKELKEVKGEYKTKMQILLEKNDNDEKLIRALKSELDNISRRDPRRGAASYKPEKSLSETEWEHQVRNLKNEAAQLRSIIKQMQVEKIETAASMGPGNSGVGKSVEGEGRPPSSHSSGSNGKMEELNKKLEKYQAQIAKLKEENKNLFKSCQENSRAEDAEIIKDISAQNALLRRKVDDFRTQLGQKS